LGTCLKAGFELSISQAQQLPNGGLNLVEA